MPHPHDEKPTQVTNPEDVFEVVGGDPTSEELTAPVPPVPIPPAATPRRPKPVAEEPVRRPGEESARVEQVWSRWSEWGGTIVLLGVVGLLVAALVYMTFSVENLGLSFLILTAGAAVWILLSYPIVITLERPVRITPEQAVKDYFAALSHHLPHYRRMWLLLSSAGHTSSSFGSYDGFKAYWKEKLAELKGSRAGRFTPLNFEVQEFKADKSAGKTFVEAKYNVAISVRGHHAEGPIETFRIRSSLVKGPDQMWYLNQGTLPTKTS